MKKILQPFQGLDQIHFGLPMSEVKNLVGIQASSVRNKHLFQEQVIHDQTTYIFEKGILVTIEMQYQESVYLNEIDIFNTQDLDALAQGHPIERKRKTMHIKGLGLILHDFFQVRDNKKRELWFYSREMLPEFDTFLDVV